MVCCYELWDFLIWEENMQCCLSFWPRVAVWKSLCDILKCSYVGSSLYFGTEPLCILRSSLNHPCVTPWTTTLYILYWWVHSNRGRIPALVPESIPLVVWLDGKVPDCPHFPSLHHPDKLPTLHLEWSMWYKCDAISHHWSGMVA